MCIMQSTTNVFKKNYQKRPRRRKRRSNLDRKIAKVANDVIVAREKKEVELKRYSYDQSYTLSSTGTIINITPAIAEGTGADERIGDQITLKSFFLRFLLEVADTYNQIRFVIFRWHDDSSPTIAKVFAPLVNLLTYTMQPLNPDNAQNIQVLYDNLFQLDTYHPAALDKIFLNKGLGAAHWNGTTAEKGQLYIAAVSDSNAVSHPSLYISWRLKFTDQ